MAGLLDGLNDAVQNPMFMGGLGLLGGGWQGAMSGMQTGMQAQEALRRRRLQQSQEEAFKGLFSGADRGSVPDPSGQGWQTNVRGPAPADGMGLPPGMAQTIRALGPEAGLPMMGQFFAKHPEMELERQRMQSQIPLLQAQAAAARAQAASAAYMTQQHQLFAPTELELKKAQLEAMRRKEPIQEFVNSLLNGGGGAAPGPTAPGAPPAVGPAPQQGGLLRPMGMGPDGPMTPQPMLNGEPQPTPQPAMMQGGTQDPRLIRVADGQPPAAPQQSVQSLIAGMSPTERAAFALKLSKDPAKAGEMLMSMDPSKIGKEASNKIDEGVMAGVVNLEGLKEMERTFDPKWQTLGGKLNASWAGLKDFVSGGNTSPETVKMLTDYHTHRTAGYEYLNQRIKLMAGTTVSGAEEKRMMSANPNPGADWWSGDSPSVYKAKLAEQMRLQKMVVARFMWLKNNGYNADQIKSFMQSGPSGRAAIDRKLPLDNMKKVIDERGQALERQLKAQNPGIGQDELRGMVRARVGQEFGLDI